MGLFNIFKQNTQVDDDNSETNSSVSTATTPTPQDDTQVTPRNEAKDLENLLALDKKLQRNREIREAQKEKEASDTTVKKEISQKPEEIRARQALSIKNPFRGV
jgi:hypothetical protein